MKVWIAFALAGPVGLLSLYLILYLFSGVNGHYIDLYWILVVPGYLGGRILGSFIAWFFVTLIIFLIYLIPFFKGKVFLSAVIGVGIYFSIVASISVKLLRNSGGF
jgi:hypothetical protein